MYLYKVMTYVDYDYFEYSYYQNEKKYTNEEFFKIIDKIDTLEEILKFNEVMNGV